MWTNSMCRDFSMAFLLATTLVAAGQGEIKVFGESNEGTIKLFASNSAPCPVSLRVELELTNMAVTDSLPAILVVPAATERFAVATLTAVDRSQRISYKSRYQYCLGNASQTVYDKDHAYSLPFAKGGRYMVFQGYNGTASHQNQNALDFTMPEGTAVLAVRDGIVVKVVENNNQSCPEQTCQLYNNYVLVYHSDGTFAEYHHLRKDGVLVDMGAKVKTGEHIANSGNTGWTTGPHLHLAIYLPRLDHKTTVQTIFMTGDGKKTETLEEKSWYERKY